MEDKLLVALLGKIQDVLSGENTVIGNESDYLAWCLPGIPFQAEDLQFAIKGLNGADGVETAQLNRNAFEFSRVANNIPDDGIINGLFDQHGAVLWNVYKDVLRFSKVPKDNLTKEEEERLLVLRNTLVSKGVKYDVLDFKKENPIETVEDSPMVKAYKAKFAEYMDAVMIYNNKRLSAINAETQLAVQDFAVNGHLYEMQVRQALNSWVSEGYKDDVEKINAYIKHTSQRSMALLKAEMEAQLDAALLKESQSGSDYYMTSLYPSSFVNSDKGWTEFVFNSASEKKYDREAHHTTNAQASYKFLFWSVKGGADNVQKDILEGSLSCKDFVMKFKITQAMLGRGWFSPEFLTNQCWDWDQKIHGVLSDGQPAPKGHLPAYATTAIFIKDIEIKSSALDTMNSTIETHVKAGASVNWGPFKLSGAHNTDDKKVESSYDKKTQTLKIKGMQLIAFKCHKLPKTPDCKIDDLQ